MTTETSGSAGSTAKGTMRVVLAESDPASREQLVERLATLPTVDLVAVEANSSDAIIAAYRLRPDAVLLDLAAPGLSAPDTIHHLQRVSPGTSVAMLIPSEGDARLTPALDAGARESVLKDAPADRLEAVLKRLGPNSRPSAAPQDA